MNAIELADELINWYPKVNLCVASAITLRQQAKEIQELKQIVESTIKQAFYEDDYYKLKAEYDLLKEKLIASISKQSLVEDLNDMHIAKSVQRARDHFKFGEKK